MSIGEWFGLIKVMFFWGIIFAIMGSGLVLFSQFEDWKLYIIDFAVAGFCIGLIISVSALSEHHSKLWILGFPVAFCSWMVCSFTFGFDLTLGENIAAAIGCGLMAILIHFLPEDGYD